MLSFDSFALAGLKAQFARNRASSEARREPRPGRPVVTRRPFETIDGQPDDWNDAREISPAEDAISRVLCFGLGAAAATFAIGFLWALPEILRAIP